MNNLISYAQEAPRADAPPMEINPEWEELTTPVTEESIENYDFNKPTPPVDIIRHQGKLLIVDGRLRFLAHKKAKRPIPFRNLDVPLLAARAEFIKRHPKI
jgi:hypothetical protein